MGVFQTCVLIISLFYSAIAYAGKVTNPRYGSNIFFGANSEANTVCKILGFEMVSPGSEVETRSIPPSMHYPNGTKNLALDVKPNGIPKYNRSSKFISKLICLGKNKSKEGHIVKLLNKIKVHNQSQTFYYTDNSSKKQICRQSGYISDVPGLPVDVNRNTFSLKNILMDKHGTMSSTGGKATRSLVSVVCFGKLTPQPDPLPDLQFIKSPLVPGATYLSFSSNNSIENVCRILGHKESANIKINFTTQCGIDSALFSGANNGNKIVKVSNCAIKNLFCTGKATPLKTGIKSLYPISKPSVVLKAPDSQTQFRIGLRGHADGICKMLKHERSVGTRKITKREKGKYPAVVFNKNASPAFVMDGGPIANWQNLDALGVKSVAKLDFIYCMGKQSPPTTLKLIKGTRNDRWDPNKSCQDQGYQRGVPRAGLLRPLPNLNLCVEREPNHIPWEMKRFGQLTYPETKKLKLEGNANGLCRHLGYDFSLSRSASHLRHGTISGDRLRRFPIAILNKDGLFTKLKYPTATTTDLECARKLNSNIVTPTLPALTEIVDPQYSDVFLSWSSHPDGVCKLISTYTHGVPMPASGPQLNNTFRKDVLLEVGNDGKVIDTRYSDFNLSAVYCY